MTPKSQSLFPTEAMEDGNGRLPPARHASATGRAPGDLPRDGGGGAVPRVPHDGRAISLTHVAAQGFLTYSTALAAYRARSDPWTLAFVVSSYATLLLFFWCLRAVETAPPEKKERLKFAIWLLGITLNLMFSYRVASMMSFGFAVAVWTIAGVTTVAAFYAFFFWEGDKNADGKGSARNTY